MFIRVVEIRPVLSPTDAICTNKDGIYSGKRSKTELNGSPLITLFLDSIIISCREQQIALGKCLANELQLSEKDILYALKQLILLMQIIIEPILMLVGGMVSLLILNIHKIIIWVSK